VTEPGVEEDIEVGRVIGEHRVVVDIVVEAPRKLGLDTGRVINRGVVEMGRNFRTDHVQDEFLFIASLEEMQSKATKRAYRSRE